MRYHFMDSMRAAMMIAGVFCHAALVYSPSFQWRFSDSSPLPAFDLLSAGVHLFRMQVFFLVAGFFCAMVFTRDPGIKKLQARLAVMCVPFFVMMLTLQPLQYALKLEFLGAFNGFGASFWNSYFAHGEFIAHLWFLINLVFYTLAAWLIAALPAGRDYFSGKAMAYALRYKTLASLIACAWYVPWRLLCKNASIGDEYDLQWVFEYAPFFLIGYILFTRQHLFEELKRVNLVDFLVLALLFLGESLVPGRVGHLLGILLTFQCAFVLTGLCVLLFYKFANVENRLTRLVSDSAYTVYLFHQVLVVLVAMAVARLIPGPAYAPVKYAIVVGVVLVLAIGAHQLLIARVPLLRFLFNGRPPAAVPVYKPAVAT